MNEEERFYVIRMIEIEPYKYKRQTFSVIDRKHKLMTLSYTDEKKANDEAEKLNKEEKCSL